MSLPLVMMHSLSWHAHTPPNWRFPVMEARHQKLTFPPPYRLEWADASSAECETQAPSFLAPFVQVAQHGCQGTAAIVKQGSDWRLRRACLLP